MPPVKQGAKSERSRKPIDITHLMKLNVTSLNRIEISTIPDVYAVTIAIMEKKDAQDLMSALKQNRVQPAHVTKAQSKYLFFSTVLLRKKIRIQRNERKIVTQHNQL